MSNGLNRSELLKIPIIKTNKNCAATLTTTEKKWKKKRFFEIKY